MQRRDFLKSTFTLPIMLLGAKRTYGEVPLQVVTTFTILADFLARIGGDSVGRANLVGPDGDAHEYEPDAEAQRQMARADLLIANGLGFEPWLDRLIASSGFPGQRILATARVTPLTVGESGEADPHAFQDPALARLYIDEILAGLARIWPDQAALFAERGAAFKASIAELDDDLRARFTALPAERRRILTSHDAFRYFGRAYGLDFIGIQGLTTLDEPSAADLAELVRQARAGRAAAIFLENMSNPAFVESLAAESGLPIGGTLYADALSPADGPAPDYLSLLRYNAEQLLAVLAA